MVKVGIISNPDRCAVIRTRLEERLEVEVDTETSLAPDWRKTFMSWDKLNFDAAIVDDAAAQDKQAMVAAIRYFQAAPRPATAHMRVVFFASDDRDPHDTVFATLATDGVFDLVLPFRDASPLGKLVELVERPARRNDVITLIAAGSPTVITDPAAAPPSVSTPLTQEERTRYLARGQSVIAVSGIMPRAGSTLASIAFARALVMLDQVPALVVDARSYEAYQACYPTAVAEDGKSYRINGVTVFEGSSPSVVPRRYTHVVLDLGYIGWGREAETVEAQRAVIEFHRADLQVVYVTCTNPTELSWLKRFMASQHPADVNRYAIGIWGTTEELFANLTASIHAKAPETCVWRMEPLAWPLSLDRIPEGFEDALEPVLPRSTKRKPAEVQPRAPKRFPWVRKEGGADE